MFRLKHKIHPLFDDETPTREMKDPRHEVDGGRVEYRDDAYRITEIQEEVQDWWAMLDPEADDGPPLTLQDKQRRPFDPNYPKINK